MPDAALDFDLLAGPTITSSLSTDTSITMDLLVEPTIQADLLLNPKKDTP